VMRKGFRREAGSEGSAQQRCVLTNELTVAAGGLMHPFGVTEYKLPPGPGYPD